jgi:hypothetical protein
MEKPEARGQYPASEASSSQALDARLPQALTAKCKFIEHMLRAKPFPNCASLKEKGSAEFDKQPRQGKALRRGQATGFLE